MVKEVHFNDGVAWRKAKELHFHDGSAWRKAKEVHVHDGSAWRQVFQGFTVDLPASIYGQGTNGASVVFLTDGTYELSDSGGPSYGNWGSPATAGIGANYWIKLVHGTGSNDWGQTSGVWYQLNSNWLITSPNQEGAGHSGTVYISSTNNDSGIIDSCSVTLES